MEVKVPSPVTIIHTGRPGHPCKVVNLEYLQEATSTHCTIPITKLVNVLKIHYHTLKHKIERNRVTHQFAALSDCDLDHLVKVFKSTKPDSKICYLVGFLHYHGLKVESSILWNRLTQLDVHCKCTKQSNSVSIWYRDQTAFDTLNEHDKLIIWGIIIHGIIDGYCYTVCERCWHSE